MSAAMVQTGHTAAAAPAAPPGTTATIKLRPPAPPAPLLRRERLLARLDEVLARRLTTVVAGAGFGKSTLLSAWAAGVNCAWYSASAEDASLAAFARGIADALRLRVPGLPPDAAGAVTAVAGPGAEEDEPARARGFAAAVCEALQSELRRDLVLVVDDVHELEASPGAHPGHRVAVPPGPGAPASRARVPLRAAVPHRASSRPGPRARALELRPRLRHRGDAGAPRHADRRR